MNGLKRIALVLLASLLPACGSQAEVSNTGSDASDAGSDASEVWLDGGEAGLDGGEAGLDAGEAGLDAGEAGLDAGEAGLDASEAGMDAAAGQLPVLLGSCSHFAILASAEITNIPTSAITGDVGLTPDTGANISGFSAPLTCPEVTGNVYAVDATGPACALIDPVLLANAKADAAKAFLDARAAVRGTPVAVSGDLNGLTLYPGLYQSLTSIEISPGGILYLDAQGDGSAVFIIRSETSITTEAASAVVLAGGAKAKNVFWTAGSTVTLGTTSIMKGTLIAGTAIALLSGADLEGRALNQGATAEAITLDQCTITVPSP